MVNIRKLMLYKDNILSQAQLKRLSEHQYSCTSVSLMDPILQPWWCWLVSKVPLWLAPNLITVIGLAINIITTLILISFSPNGREDAPRWASALCALGLFIYQSLDAIDGKQARRTNSSSPLGELFDHGCDSISTIFVALSACISVKLGFHPKWLFFQCFCAMTLFYCAHWQTYVSGTLRFGKIDVTEAQCTIMMIHVMSAVFGPNIWATKIIGFEIWNTMCFMTIVCGSWAMSNIIKAILSGGIGKNGSTVAIPIANVDVKICVLYFAVAVAAVLAFRNASIIFTGGVGKNGSTVAGTSVISPIIPFAMVVLPAFIISEKSVDRIFENHPSLYILAFGMVAAKVTNKLVIAHMTKSEMEYSDWGLVGPLLLFLNQYFNNFLPEYLVLWMAVIWGTIDLLRYCSQVCLEICDHLHVELFRIPYPAKSSQQSSSSTIQYGSNSNDRNGLNRHQSQSQTAQTIKKSIRHSKRATHQ